MITQLHKLCIMKTDMRDLFDNGGVLVMVFLGKKYLTKLFLPIYMIYSIIFSWSWGL